MAKAGGFLGFERWIAVIGNNEANKFNDGFMFNRTTHIYFTTAQKLTRENQQIEDI